jgi:hypothetical protein
VGWAISRRRNSQRSAGIFCAHAHEAPQAHELFVQVQVSPQAQADFAHVHFAAQAVFAQQHLLSQPHLVLQAQDAFAHAHLLARQHFCSSQAHFFSQQHLALAPHEHASLAQAAHLAPQVPQVLQLPQTGVWVLAFWPQAWLLVHVPQEPQGLSPQATFGFEGPAEQELVGCPAQRLEHGVGFGASQHSSPEAVQPAAW